MPVGRCNSRRCQALGRIRRVDPQMDENMMRCLEETGECGPGLGNLPVQIVRDNQPRPCCRCISATAAAAVICRILKRVLLLLLLLFLGRMEQPRPGEHFGIKVRAENFRNRTVCRKDVGQELDPLQESSTSQERKFIPLGVLGKKAFAQGDSDFQDRRAVVHPIPAGKQAIQRLQPIMDRHERQNVADDSVWQICDMVRKHSLVSVEACRGGWQSGRRCEPRLQARGGGSAAGGGGRRFSGRRCRCWRPWRCARQALPVQRRGG